MALEKSIKIASLIYDPAIYGFDNSFWKTTTGSPTVVSGKIRFTSATAYSTHAFRFGRVAFALNIPVAPTSGQTRSWGLGAPSSLEKAVFNVTDAVFTTITTDAAGVSTTTVVPFVAGWAAAEKLYEIVWSYAPQAKSVQFLVNGSVVATHTTHLPTNPLFAFLNNGTADNADLGMVYVNNSDDPISPVNSADTNFIGYESLTFTIGSALTNVDIADTYSPLFTHAYKQFTITAGTACTVKVNSSSNGAIALAVGMVRTFDKFTSTNCFITTTGSTVISIDGWY